jgi:hypothetical protein
MDAHGLKLEKVVSTCIGLQVGAGRPRRHRISALAGTHGVGDKISVISGPPAYPTQPRLIPHTSIRPILAGAQLRHGHGSYPNYLHLGIPSLPLPYLLRNRRWAPGRCLCQSRLSEGAEEDVGGGHAEGPTRWGYRELPDGGADEVAICWRRVPSMPFSPVGSSPLRSCRRVSHPLSATRRQERRGPRTPDVTPQGPRR